MVYEKKCPTCGTLFKTNVERQKYCCHSCGHKNRRSKEGGAFEESLLWEKTEKGLWRCPYNMAVDCSERKCITCGWNPEVAEARTKKILEAYGCV